MYQIDRTLNRITPIQNKKFSDLGFTERQHLQEWLAYQPDALGEELLIIQKEFNGFDGTQERLDLLALDKIGNLVIIENKLDDSGRDVVWQALKYASYCANLSKQQIITMFQQYLDKYATDEKALAQDLICEFLNVAEVDELKINLGNKQRIVLVAAAFRKEVTNTALWLSAQKVSVECFKVTPYALGEQILLNVEKIVPTPEVEDLMIGIFVKEAEEQSAEIVLKERHHLRLAFWKKTIESFRKSPCRLFDNRSPSKDHWLSAGSGLSGCQYNLLFTNKFISVEFSLQRSSQIENKLIFDRLFKQKTQIEQDFGQDLTWMRLPEKKASRVQFYLDIDASDKDKWDEMVQWLITHMQKLEAVFKKPLDESRLVLNTVDELETDLDSELTLN